MQFWNVVFPVFLLCCLLVRFLVCILDIFLLFVSVSNCQTKPADAVVEVETRPDMRVSVCCCILDVNKYKVASCLHVSCQPLCCRSQDFSSTRPSVVCAFWLCVRYKIKCLVEHRYFEWLVLFLIAASSIALVRTLTDLSCCYTSVAKYTKQDEEGRGGGRGLLKVKPIFVFLWATPRKIDATQTDIRYCLLYIYWFNRFWSSFVFHRHLRTCTSTVDQPWSKFCIISTFSLPFPSRSSSC